MTRICEVTQDSSDSVDDNSELRELKKFARNMLKSHIFMGTFQEKRHVPHLNSYRDVIRVSDENIKLIKDLQAVKRRCERHFSSTTKWIGITEPETIGAPCGYNLWVTLEEEVFGSYFYEIKKVDFHPNEVRVKLAIKRPFSEEQSSTSTLGATPNTSINNNTTREANASFLVDDFNVGLNNLKSTFTNKLSQLRQEIEPVITYNNVKTTTIFLFVLLSTLATFAVQALIFLMDYLLKLMHQTTKFVEVLTPIFVSIINLMHGVILGIFGLFLAMWTSSRKPVKVENHYNTLYYQDDRGNFRQQGAGPNYGVPFRTYKPIRM